MKSGSQSGLREQILAQAIHSLAKHHLPRVERCLSLLSSSEIWWRPNAASNSIGNLVLHLSGNVRQWIISGLGGAPDRRVRDKEFAERGPISRRTLRSQLRNTLTEAARVIGRLSGDDLESFHEIQGFTVTGFKAVQHVVEHFAFHTGQIIMVAKMKRDYAVSFTQLPGEKRLNPSRAKLPVL